MSTGETAVTTRYNQTSAGSKRLAPIAADRALYAEPQGNGVTGFVAATGKSYLCEDTENDPIYLPGAPEARSSLTVPLVLHDEILGTFNVESPRVGAFNEHDLQFVQRCDPTVPGQVA